MRAGVEVEGHERAARRIFGLGERVENPRPGFDAVANLLRQDRREQFATGRGWERLRRSTIRRKRQRGQDSRVLVGTGALMSALTRRGDRHAKLDFGRQQLTFGPRLFYARFVSERRHLNEVRRATRRKIAKTLRRWIFKGGADR